jgi:DNA polymerase-3 subunit gamma/tau
MSLYRTWRPKSFADLVGQDAVVRTLEAALLGGKLAHAYLFSGPRGSGKTSAAKILARCIDCVRGPTPAPDNTCENCRAILAGTALDVLEIDAASNNGVDDIRAIREAVKFPPATMRSKVYIIDEAHMISTAGANAFLKTLEEPPPHVVFILATTDPLKLPPTILSRCQRYAFRRIPVPVMIARMREIAAAESIAIDDGALGAIAYRADGGLRDALTMLEQVAAYASGPVDAATVEAAFGTTGADFARALVDAIAASDAPRALRSIDEAADAGADLAALTRAAVAEFRHLMIAQVDADLLARDLAAEDAARVSALAARVPQARAVHALRLLGDALGAARSSGNARIELETAVLRLIVQSEEPPERPAPPPARLAPRPAAERTPDPAPAPPPAPASAEPASLQKIRSLWSSVRTRVEGERAPLRGPLSHATVDELDGGVLTLKLRDEANAAILRDSAALVERALRDLVGNAVKLSVKVENAPARAGGPKRAHGERQEDGDLGLLAYAMERLAGENR